MLTRFSDWPGRLDLFLAIHARDRFQYGRVDCCLFVADAVLAMTGTDLAVRFRGKYATRAEAMKAVKAYCGIASVRAAALAIAHEHGMPDVSIWHAQRGDMLLVKRARDFSLGLLALNGREILAASAEGFLRLPLSHAIHAWRV